MENGRRISSGDKYHYSSTLTLCLLSSLGICFAFLPSLPVKFDTRLYSEATYVATTIALTIAILSVEFQMIRFIRSKKRFHQGQVVFWPMRCRHCARTLGVLQPSPGVESFDDNRGDTVNGSALPVGYNMPEEHPQKLLACQNQNCVTSDQVSSDLSLKRNRSLVDVFVGFSCLAIFTAPCFAIGKFICIAASGEASVGLYISAVLDLSLISVLPVGILFCCRYHDAIFVTNAENVFTIVVVLSACIWASTWNLVVPISGLLEEEPSNHLNCLKNDTLENFFRGIQRAMVAFFMQCGIIATGILWQMWKSFVPKSVVRVHVEMPRYDAFFEVTSTPYGFLSRAMKSLAFFCRFRSTTDARNASSALGRFANKIWVASFLSAFVYFASNIVFIFGPKIVPDDHDDEILFVLYCLEMAFCLPLLMIFLHMSLASKDTSRPTDLSGMNNAHLPLEGHDVLLLLCTCGIFCQCFIRVTASIGLLFSGQYVHPDRTALFIVALVYSVVIVVMVWCTTSFLLRVQRRLPQPSEIKCVLALLIYITVSNSTEWLIESLYVEVFTVQTLYFGKTTGKVIGVLLDPFATLYGLHAAMVAYEAYKSIIRRTT